MNHWQSIVVALGILVFGWVFYTHSFQYELEVVSAFQAPPLEVAVSKDQPLLIPLRYPEKYLAGVVMYAANKATTSLIFDLSLLDGEGREVAKKTRQIISYPQSGDPIITIYLSKHASIKSGQLVTLRLAPHRDQTAVLRATIPTDGAADPVLVFSTLHRKPVSLGTQQGALVGTALGLALLLLSLVKGRSVQQQWAGAILFICLAAFLITLPYTYRAMPWGIGDWDYHHSQAHIYQQTIREYGEVPLWNPYFCGGTAALGDPEYAVLTPAFALQYFWGVETGAGLVLLLGFIITGMGVVVLGKYLGLAPVEAALSALIVIGSSALVLKASEGHLPIIFAYMWVPWILWSWLQNKSFRCGIFLTFALLQGGIYILSYTAIALGILLFMQPNRWQSFRSALVAGLWMLGLSSWQFIPTLYWLAEYQDEAFVASTNTLMNLPDIFFGRYMHNAFVINNQVSGWHEYGAYIGYGVLILALIGTSYIRSRKVVLALIVCTVVALAISSAGPVLEPLFSLLPFIPRSNISRVVLFTLLGLGLLAGFGFKRLTAQRGWAQVMAIVLAGFICIDLASLAYPIAEQGFTVPRVNDPLPAAMYPISYTDTTHTVRQQGRDIPRAYGATLQGYGTFSFCGVVGPDSAVALPTSDQPAPFITTTTAAEAKLLSWSPNTIRLKVSALQESKVTLNVNYAPGWQTNYGEVLRDQSPLTIAIPAGEAEMKVHYQPPGLLLGIAVTVLTLLAAAARLRVRLRPQ